MKLLSTGLLILGFLLLVPMLFLMFPLNRLVTSVGWELVKLLPISILEIHSWIALFGFIIIILALAIKRLRKVSR